MAKGHSLTGVCTTSSVILNINQSDSDWSLVPTYPIDSALGEHVARGTGNAVSIEFNLLYRWHSCIGEKDTRYIEEIMRRYSRTPPEEVSHRFPAAFENCLVSDARLLSFR